MVEFASFTPEEDAAVEKIIARANAVYTRHLHPSRPPMQIRMDLSAVHAKTPLRLEEMAEADDFDLIHDVGGIARHLNRKTGEIEDFFVPRFAAPVVPEDVKDEARQILDSIKVMGD